jgi:hypothetical protein
VGALETARVTHEAFCDRKPAQIIGGLLREYSEINQKEYPAAFPKQPFIVKKESE